MRHYVASGIALAVGILLILAYAVVYSDLKEIARRDLEAFERATGSKASLAAIDETENVLVIWWEEIYLPASEVPSGGTLQFRDHVIRPQLVRSIEPDEGIENAEALRAVVVELPNQLRADIPPTGRLKTPEITAEFRKVVEWNGTPLSVDTLFVGIARFLTNNFATLLTNNPNTSPEQLQELAAEIEKADTPAAVQTALLKSKLTYGGRSQPLTLRPILRDMINDRTIPAPKSLDDAAHAELREHFPGNSAQMVLQEFAFRPFPQKVHAYATAENLSADAATERIQWAAAIMEVPFHARYALTEPENATRKSTFFSVAFYLIPAALFFSAYFYLYAEGFFEHLEKVLGWSPVAANQPADPNEAANEQSSTASAPSDTSSTSKDQSGAPAPTPYPVSQPAATSSKSVTTDKPLMATNVSDLHKSLSQKGPLGRKLDANKHVSVSTRAREVVDADTNLIKAQAEQVEMVLQKQNTIQSLQDEAELLPFRQMEQLTTSLATIAENELRAAKAKKEIRDLNQPPQPQVTVHSDSHAVDPMEILEKNWRSRLGKSVVARQTVYEKLEREGKERFRDNDQLLRIYLDKLAQLFEEEHTA